MVDASVLFATRNGSHVLGRTLEGYRSQIDSGYKWKLIIVDNGSSDQSREIIQSYKRSLPIELYFEPRAGKNRALNVGLAAIEGGLVIVTDDDSIPKPDFLTSWRDALRVNLDYQVFGGTVLPLFEVAPPEWMARGELKYDALYAVRKLKEGPIDPTGIFGPNMALRAELFAQGMRFDEAIGPNGEDASYPMGSETEFCVRASRAGFKTWFASKPSVQHIVRQNQINSKYWAKRAYRLGRGAAYLQWESGELVPAIRRPALVAAAGRAWRRLNGFCLLSKTLNLNPAKRFTARWEYDWYCGFLDEYSRRRNTYFWP
jgi:glycosyltransferase involved in cell wall biosynthesis